MLRQWAAPGAVLADTSQFGAHVGQFQLGSYAVGIYALHEGTLILVTWSIMPAVQWVAAPGGSVWASPITRSRDFRPHRRDPRWPSPVA
jgi:hypothetical protein